MSSISAVTKIDLPHKVSQGKVKAFARELFVENFPQIDRILSIFDNTEIISRNLCKPLRSYDSDNNFEDNNKEFIHFALDYSIHAIEECLIKANINKLDVTDLIFVSSTGLATPSLDALIINKMKMNPHTNRMSIFGLGCAGGVSGMAKANAIALSNPKAIVLLVSVELCSLTFLRRDFSKSNFVASSLFSDGIAACIIKGDAYKAESTINIIASGSKLYFDSLDVMGWEFLDVGFKVLFSESIPALIDKNIKADVVDFLTKNNLVLSDIKNFIFHPGGKKVLTAYTDALKVEGDFLKITRETMNDYGNMSSTTVLYVLENFLNNNNFETGYGLMVAMGPGFSSEIVLLDMQKK
ncbi:MAG: type III polyketide synthase [Mariniphaga sp.]|nr:type III polyketide synthase [Mariniphaga sp.]